MKEQLKELTKQSVDKVVELIDLRYRLQGIVKDISTDELKEILRDDKELRDLEREFSDLLKQVG